MKKAVEFQAHIELSGLFEVFVIPVPDGTRFQFYSHPATEEGFDAYLAKRFANLGQPADLVYHEDIKCFEAFFRGLRYQSPEEALKALSG